MNQAAAPNPEPERYRFDGFVVDVAAHTLTRDGQPCALEPKAFAVLLALLRRQGELQGRDDLLDQVWGHRHVTPGVLTRAIAQLRAVLEDDPHRPGYIQTQHGLGYRFVGRLKADANPDVGADQGRDLGPCVAEPPADEPEAEPLSSVALAARHSRLEVSPPEVSILELTANPLAESAAQPAAQPDVPRPYAGTERRRTVSVGRWAVVVALAALVMWAGFYWLRPPALSASPSIAVLPFTSISSDPDDTYFAEGLAVEMHDALAGVQGLQVAAQLSPAMAPAADADVKALGTRFGVASVLGASVRREGARVRINARLSDTITGYTLWSHSYDRELSDVFATQGEIADEVVQSLMGVLPGQREALARRLRPTRDLAAFDSYLRGLQSLRSASGGDRGKSAIGFFNTALAKDAGFVRAQAALCRAEARRFEYWHDSEAYGRARRACTRAGELDPGSAEAALAFGNLHRVRREFPQALAQYRKVADDLVLRPDGYIGLAKVYAAQGRKELAQQNFQRALALRPGDSATHMEIGFQAYLDGHMAVAIAQYRRALALDSRDAGAWNTLGFFHLASDEDAQAVRAFERSIAIRPNADALGNMGTLKFASGDYTAATALYLRATELDPDDHINWGNLGEGLLAGSAPAAQVRDAFEQAHTRVERYLALNPSDGEALAAQGWYRANLRQGKSALELVRQSAAKPGDPAEIALYNSLTLGALGRKQGLLQQLGYARAAGMTEKRIAATEVLRREQVQATATATATATASESQ